MNAYRMSVLTICVVALGLFASVACKEDFSPRPRPTEGEVIGLVQENIADKTLSSTSGTNCLALIQYYGGLKATQEEDGNWMVKVGGTENPVNDLGPWRVFKNSWIVQSLGRSC